MKNLLLASVALLTLGAAVPSYAQTNADTGAAVGGTAGATGGAVAGFLVGGPIGAVIGGFAGAAIGAEAGVATTTIDFAGNHPVEPIYLDSAVDVGVVVPADVNIYPVEGDDRYGYIYANDRVWIVDMQTRTLVQSPGYLVPQTAADYAAANPIASANVQGDVVVGYVVPDDVELVQVPDARSYSYVYVNDRPALVDTSNRTIVWIK